MRKIYLFVVLFLVLSCNKNQVFRKMDTDLKDNRWYEKEAKVFEFEIVEEGNYNVFVELSHVMGTQFDKLPIELKVVRPGGEKEIAPLELDCSKSDCTGDICDLKQLIKQKQKLVKGNYKIEIKPKTSFGFAPNIIGVGFAVEKYH